MNVSISRYLCFGLVALLLVALVPQGASAQEGGWRTIGPLPTPGVSCADATQPNTVLLSYDTPRDGIAVGSYALNWTTGERTTLGPVPFSICNTANGLLYGHTPGAATTPASPALRWSSSEREPRQIARTPTHLAIDGSLWGYSFGGGLWASSDGGLSWQERRLPTADPLFGMAVAPADGRALYLLAGAPAPEGSATSFTVFFSPDAGATWERRGSDSLSNGGGSPPPDLTISTFASTAAPVGVVMITTSSSSSGRFATRTTVLSADGGRTFRSAAIRGAYQLGQLLHTVDGLVRLSGAASPGGTDATLERSTDGGASWQAVALPFPVRNEPPASAFISQAFYAPDALLLPGADGALWFSPDGARSWQLVGRAQGGVSFTPYLPLSAYTTISDQLTILDLPDVGRSFTRPALAKGLTDGAFFPETGHNLGGVFKGAWKRNGGLALFGYPKSEPLREVNGADGRVYLVQYFERNRFEYHPEFAGTPNEVLLGLLGNQITAGRRAANEGPFNPVANPNAPGTVFFPQTGHTLGGAFRSYWARNGGERIFGYPISEPFTETNPADGRDYLVQYFERNRFEYHPENAATPNEVLLGLLGNQVLREKGWE